MRIGEFAKHTSSNVETVRYYERAGLLPAPVRTSGNYRLYGAPHIDRLLFIKHCRTLDMTLDEIRSLLSIRDTPKQNCHAVNLFLDRHISEIAKRIQELSALQSQLESLRGVCNSSRLDKDCNILHNLSSAD